MNWTVSPSAKSCAGTSLMATSCASGRAAAMMPMRAFGAARKWPRTSGSLVPAHSCFAIRDFRRPPLPDVRFDLHQLLFEPLADQQLGGLVQVEGLGGVDVEVSPDRAHPLAEAGEGQGA